eukprot:2708165-Pyramimonas_sp.AAC.1
MSVFTAFAINLARPLPERSMTGHLRWLADQLRAGRVVDILWRGTRDMRADPMTKGGASRDLIADAMGGNFSYGRAA